MFQFNWEAGRLGYSCKWNGFEVIITSFRQEDSRMVYEFTIRLFHHNTMNASNKLYETLLEAKNEAEKQLIRLTPWALDLVNK